MRHLPVFRGTCFFLLVLVMSTTFQVAAFTGSAEVCTLTRNGARSLLSFADENSSAVHELIWLKTFGGENYDEARSIIQTSDGGYAIAGYTTSYGTGTGDFWLVKTDNSGNEEWSKTFGGESVDWAYSVIQTSDGGYALAGSTYSYGAGETDFWLVKTDNSGNEVWNKTFGSDNTDTAHSVIQTSDGGYLLAGYTWSFLTNFPDFWIVKTGPSGNKEWSKIFGGVMVEEAYSVIQTSDGGYAIAGYTTSYGTGTGDFWLVKTDNSGSMQWSKTFGGENDEWAYSVIQTSDGGYALAGHTTSYGAGSYDFWLVKTDNSGNEVWNKTFGGKGKEVAYSIIQTSDGGYALAGEKRLYDAFDLDFGIVKTDPLGNKEWSGGVGGWNNDGAYSIIQAFDGGYILAGYTESYGAATYGSYDVWLVKLQGPKGGEIPSGGGDGFYLMIGAIVAIVVAVAFILFKKYR